MKKLFLIFVLAAAFTGLLCSQDKKTDEGKDDADFKTYEEYIRYTSFENTLKRFSALLESLNDSVRELKDIPVCGLDAKLSAVVLEKKVRNYRDLLHHSNSAIDYLLRKKQHLLLKYEEMRKESVFGKHPRFDYRNLRMRYTGKEVIEKDNCSDTYLKAFFKYAKDAMSGILDLYDERLQEIRANKDLQANEKKQLMLPIKLDLFKLYLEQDMIKDAEKILSDDVFSGNENAGLKEDLTFRLKKAHQAITYGRTKYLIRHWAILLLSEGKIDRNLKYYYVENANETPYYFKLHKPETDQKEIDDVYKDLFYEFETQVILDQKLYEDLEDIYATWLKRAREKLDKANVLAAISVHRGNNCNFAEAIEACDKIVALGGCGFVSMGEMAKIPVHVRETMSYFHIRDNLPVINLPPLKDKKRLEELSASFAELTKIDFSKKFDEQYLITRKTFSQFTIKLKELCDAAMLLRQGIFAQEAQIFDDAKKDYNRNLKFLITKKAEKSGTYRETFFRSGVVAREKKEYKDALEKFDLIINTWKEK